MRRQKAIAFFSCLLWILTVTAKPCQGQNQLPKTSRLSNHWSNSSLTMSISFLSSFRIGCICSISRLLQGEIFCFLLFISLPMFSLPAFLFARWLMIDGQWTSNIPWSVSAHRTSSVLVRKVTLYSNSWVTAPPSNVILSLDFNHKTKHDDQGLGCESCLPPIF